MNNYQCPHCRTVFESDAAYGERAHCTHCGRIWDVVVDCQELVLKEIPTTPLPAEPHQRPACLPPMPEGPCQPQAPVAHWKGYDDLQA